MEKPLPTNNESDRIAALNRYKILDTDFEESFDDIAKIASSICETPIALVSLIDPDRQWFKASVGLDVRETPRDIAFCAHAIHNSEVMIVPDTLEDQRFHDNPLVSRDPRIRFYAGAPLITQDGFALGTLCTIDRKPRELSGEQIESLQALARQVSVNLELRRGQHNLSKLNESKNRLFSIISHDIRSPLHALNSIIGNLEAEATNMSPDERNKWIQLAKRSADTSLSVAESLLKWSNFEEGNFNFEPTEISLSQLVDDIRPLLELNIRDKEIELHIDIRNDSRVNADRTMLHSIVQNLISNAVKFTPRGGSIYFTISEDDQFAHIEISDTGTGIDASTLENLFNIEKTYSREGTEGEKGTGLGLTLCKQFAEKNGGHLNIESEPGKGTLARLKLPLLS